MTYEPMDFTIFGKAVNVLLTQMSQHQLYKVDVTKDELFDLYLASFPEGTNPMFRERTEHDCNCCKSFIRVMGGVVAIINGERKTIWDISIGEGYYQEVADALAAHVRTKPIVNKFLHTEKRAGMQETLSLVDGEIETHNHFWFDIPQAYVSTAPGTALSQSKADYDVLKRSVEELTDESVEMVLEWIEGNQLPRGAEYKESVVALKRCKREVKGLTGQAYDDKMWALATELGRFGRVRNNAMGTLLIDLSEDMEIDKAYRRYLSVTDPENMNRSKTPATKKQREAAKKFFVDNGYMDSLERRHATLTDISINDVRFADRSAQKLMLDAFDVLESKVVDKPPSLKNVEEIGVDKFLSKILPGSKGVSVLFEEKHQNNLMTLLAPVHPEAKNMFKHDNNFTVAFNGDLADSAMKRRVKEAGGCVDGALRFSIQWNEDGNNQDDLDAHCKQPGRYDTIYYGNKGRRHSTSGMLDVDIISPGGDTAVENIIFTDLNKMPDGKYQFLTHVYSSRNGRGGFRAEVEFGGKIFKFNYEGASRSDAKIKVADVTLKNGEFTIKTHLPFGEGVAPSKEIWNINTTQYVKVNAIMDSPNHWGGQEVGNKQLLFILEGCKNPDDVRGFFTEHLNAEMHEHRKALEMLGSVTKVPYAEEQMSGLGFNYTTRNEVVVKVEGATTRHYKVKF